MGIKIQSSSTHLLLIQDEESYLLASYQLMQVDDLHKIETEILSFFKQLYTDNRSLVAWFTS